MKHTLAAALALLMAGPAAANDYPTLDRVLYVQECMRENPGPSFEMITKCSCALDRIAAELKHADFVEMQTIVNAMSIGGERGNDLRDNDTLKPKARKYREVRAAAAKACFIQPR